jgi:rod shape-determining protein MreC
LKRKNWLILGALVAGWIIFLGQPITFSSKLRSVFSHIATPFVKLGDLIPVIHFRHDLEKQNSELRTENVALRQQLTALANAGRENIELHELLNLKQHVPAKTIGAHVIGRDSSNWWRSLQIDRGSNDGLHENMAVISAKGLVGKIVSVTKGDARVLLLSDPNCKVSALLQDTRSTGIASGVGEAIVRSPRCIMTYVPRDARPRQNEAIITSGLGGVFPKGILIGNVISVQLNPQTGMYLDVEVKPAVDFQRIEEVMVILQ